MDGGEVIGKIKLYAAAALAFLLAIVTFGQAQKRKGRKAERDKQEMKRLKDDKATRERIDNAKPANNPDDARTNLSDWLRGRK